MRTVLLILKLILVTVVLSVTSVTVGYLYFSSNLPELSTLSSYQPPLVSRIFNAEGELLAEYADEHRILTPISEIPKQLTSAFLAAEDDHFYQHPGINPPRILAAAIANFKAGHTVQGGSTITQQVAKNFLLTPERSYTRKIREIILAWRIEQAFSKDDILYLYMNHIYLGRGSYGVASAAWRYFRKSLNELTLAECAMLAGLPKAPGKYAPHLNPELAIARRNTVLRMIQATSAAEPHAVASALQEPLNIQPMPSPRFADAYGASVYEELVQRFGLKTLRRQGLTIIVPYDHDTELAAINAVRRGVLEVEQRQFYRPPINHPPKTWAALLESWQESSSAETLPTPENIFPALVEEVPPEGNLLVNDGRRRWLLSKPKWQWEKPKIEKSSEDIARARTWIAGDEIMLQGNGKGGVRITQTPSVEGSLYAIDMERGTVLARVGGFDFTFAGFDRVDSAMRQPGSAFKPFLYATAMDMDMTPATIIMDSPVVFENRNEGDFWRPENYKNRFAGSVTLRDALEHSRNLASIKLLQDIGIDTFLRALKRYPFTHTFPRQLALSLGATEVTLKELSESYLLLADQGRRWQPVQVQQVQDRNGRTLHRAVAGHRCQVCHVDPVFSVGHGMRPYEQAIDPVSSFLTTRMLEGVIQRGTGRRARALNRPAAGKTGTTNKQVDAWFMGYTPQILTGVWVGRDTPTSMGRRETGSRAALPIWLDAMKSFHKGKPVKAFASPDGIEWVTIDRKTGQHARSDTKEPLLESFRTGTSPEIKLDSGKESAPADDESFFDLDL